MPGVVRSPAIIGAQRPSSQRAQARQRAPDGHSTPGWCRTGDDRDLAYHRVEVA